MSNNLSNPLMYLLENNHSALHKFYNCQELLIDYIVSQSSTESAFEIMPEIVGSNQKVLENFFQTNERIVSYIQFAGSSLYQSNVTDESPEVKDNRPEPDSDITSSPHQTGTPTLTKGEILERWIKEYIAGMIGLTVDMVSIDVDLEDELGLDSLRIVEFWEDFCKHFPEYKQNFNAIQHVRTIKELVRFLSKEVETEKKEKNILHEGRHWVIDEIATLTGIPSSSITNEQLLEDDLGIDSIHITSLRETVFRKQPELKDKRIDFSSISSVADLINVLEDTGQKDVPELHEFTQEFQFVLNERFKVQLDTHENYYNTGKLNAFQMEEVLEQTFKKFPYLTYLKRTFMNLQSVHEIDAIAKQVPVSTQTTSSLSDEPLQRIVWKSASNKISIPFSPLAKKILIFGQKENLEKWSGFFKNVSHIEPVGFEEKKWYYNNEEYIPDQPQSLEKLSSSLNPFGFGLIIFLANCNQNGKTKMVTSGLQLLRIAQWLNKSGKEKQEELNITVLQEVDSLIAQIAARGVAKTLSKEWEGIKVRTITFQNDIFKWNPENVLQVLQNAPERHDLVIKENDIYISSLLKDTDTGLLQDTDIPDSINNDEGVILLLGGASGITAEITKFFSSRFNNLHYVCVGRTQKPEKEPYPGITSDVLTIKDMISTDEFKNLPVKELQEKLKSIKRQKSIFSTEKEVVNNKARFHYISGDTTNLKDIKQILAYCSKLAPIVGVVHGCGFAKDTRFENKSEETFESVFNTKALTAWHLYNELKDEPNLYFVFFMSSLASVYGNSGQADYVAGNDFLNELAIKWNQEVSYKVKSLIWGVWLEAGFVTENSATQKLFYDLGVHGIKNKSGAEALLRELKYSDKENAAVILTTPSCHDYVKTPLIY